ncbi:KEOPS complex kinase/ATPase Bud32 [Candidatus Nitrosotenuis sp. DW1]|uniref:KEOPS complex kinase/ATPase Bud32 n=1 Tax=Candidatus Nitrosotenuis sp. DW1 TaxID=2259672 RepID=UPI0015CB6333|nr:KEOPS complex kinase/ATPase Bud32 [Candidatus Nitrosotenuis sp. DW1]QLH08346.1 Kae1-associated kinase Bud32 [Candidatus Nitrosotenuis sp. DW1]
MKLLKKGAEGDIFLTRHENVLAILKTRKKKQYRNQILDDKIRKSRTIRESTILSEAKEFGIRTPLVYQVNHNDCTILMQHIKGNVVRDLAGSNLVSACKEIGKITGTLHKNGIMHGDLTTSNFILSDGKVYTIDFGLSQRTAKIEDHAVDLRLFKEILNSAHVDVLKSLWSSFLQGYRSAVGHSRYNQILNHVSVIEGRGRYAQVV